MIRTLWIPKLCHLQYHLNLLPTSGPVVMCHHKYQWDIPKRPYQIDIMPALSKRKSEALTENRLGQRSPMSPQPRVKLNQDSNLVPAKMQPRGSEKIYPLSLLPQPDEHDTNIVSADNDHFNMIYDRVQVSTRKQLSEIVNDFSSLPLSVVFCDSIYGFAGSFTFCRDELFDVHFMKESVMANVQMSRGKHSKFLSSSSRF